MDALEVEQVAPHFTMTEEVVLPAVELCVAKSLPRVLYPKSPGVFVDDRGRLVKAGPEYSVEELHDPSLLAEEFQRYQSYILSSDQS